MRLDRAKREAELAAWNHPVWWPLLLIGGVLAAMVLIARSSLRRRERTNARGEVLA